ncbi:MAG TPA: hypothetical protein VFR55_04890, partial [Dehalococcoidia bacterium]|nr:hypothetical protein [Dehalococcoidia bacterium]
TVKDIEAVPAVPTKRSFTILSLGPGQPQIRREPWGANDLYLAPNGDFAWVKAGEPMPPLDQFRPASEFRNGTPVRARDRTRSEFRSRSIRGRRL